MMKEKTAIRETQPAKSINAVNTVTIGDKMRSYLKNPASFIMMIFVMLAAFVTFAALLFIICYVLIKGVPNLTPSLFAWEYNTENVSMLPSIINTLIMTVVSLVIAIPLGLFTAIYLVEYSGKNNSKIVQIIRLTTETLSGIPSIVYGLFGMLFFVTALHWGYSILAGAFTMSIMILPLIMRTAEEALLAVSDSFREASYGLGAGKLRTIFKIVLPSAMPGIAAGIILAIGRIVGETAALMYTSGTVAEIPSSLMSSGRTLALHMYALSSEGLYEDQAYATAVVLLVFVLLINTLSSFIARKLTKSEFGKDQQTMDNKIPKFSIKNMDLYYGNFHALKDINMDIPANQITAFIGPSGCGKSTLLKSLNRMNDLVEGCKITGDIKLDGTDIYGQIDVNNLRKRVGMVFQKPNPFPMSIYDNIAYGPRTHGIRSKSKLDEIVETSLRNAAIWDEVKDRLKKSALSMSGGQQQRLCIARAMAVEPEVLLMDEPTSALDPISTSKIEDLVIELKDKFTIVMVTHNMQQATRVSDRTAFFLLGEVVEYNTTDKLFSVPSDKRTEDYITGRFG